MSDQDGERITTGNRYRERPYAHIVPEQQEVQDDGTILGSLPAILISIIITALVVFALKDAPLRVTVAAAVIGFVGTYITVRSFSALLNIESAVRDR